MGKLISELSALKQEIELLKARIRQLEATPEDRRPLKPYSKVGGNRDQSHARPVDIKTSLGNTYGGNLCWNDAELVLPPYGAQPASPSVGYHKHHHGLYSGGPLDVLTLQLVRYDYGEGGQWNPHTQQFWTEQPPLLPATNAENSINDILLGNLEAENSDKQIGRLGVIFSHGINMWTPMYIDISRCYFVVPNPEEKPGGIKKSPAGSDMMGKLYDEDESKTSFVWDDTAAVWRLYAVYAEEQESEEEE